MKIFFKAAWAKGNVMRKNFKSDATFALAEEYVGRICHFAPCKLLALEPKLKKSDNSVLWFCDTAKNAQALSTGDLALRLRQLETSGVREWSVVIGGADGFDEESKRRLKPDFLWSFGPMTLPHELALVVAVEQVYRAYTVLRNLPYHTRHAS